MMTLSMPTPFFSRLFALRTKTQPVDDQPEHEAAMAQRALLAEMISRSPDTFHSDLDVMMATDPYCVGF